MLLFQKNTYAIFIILNIHIMICLYEALKIQSYMITSTEITNTEFFSFIAVLVFKLLIRKVLFMNRKDNKNR